MANETGTPATVWKGRGGEFIASGPFLLADASGRLLIDSSGRNLIDSGVKFSSTAATKWSRDDSK